MGIKIKKKITTKGEISLGILLYVLFAMANLIFSSWIPVVSYEIFADFGFQDLSDNADPEIYYLGPGLYIEQLGHPRIGSNLILFYEGPENQARIFNLFDDNYGSDIGNRSLYTQGNYTAKIIELLGNTHFYDSYGKSVLGVYNLEPDINGDPKILWVQDSTYYNGWEIKKVKQVPDVDGDGIVDLFVSKAEVIDYLPMSDELTAVGGGEESSVNYTDYFLNNPDDFDYYFNVTIINEEEINGTRYIKNVAVTPNYRQYSHVLISGASGLPIKDSNNRRIEFGNKNLSVVDVVLMNGDLNVSNGDSWDLNDSRPELLLLESTLDYSIYRNSMIYFKLKDINPMLNNSLRWSDEINSYFLINGSRAWSLNSESLKKFKTTYKLGEDYIDPNYGDSWDYGWPNKLPLSYKFFSFDEYGGSTIKTAVNISLGEYGFRKLQSIGNGFYVEFSSDQYFEGDAVINSYVFDSNGDLLWNKKGELIIGHRDFDGDGLFNIGQYILKPRDDMNYTYDNGELTVDYFKSAKFYLYNETNGKALAAYEFDLNGNESYFTTTLFSYMGYSDGVAPLYPAPLGLTFSSDDQNGDGIPEIIGYVIKEGQYNEEYQNYEWILYNFRLTLTPTWANTSLSRLIINIAAREEDNDKYYIYVQDPLPKLSSFKRMGNVVPIHLDFDGDNLDDYMVGKDRFLYDVIALDSSQKALFTNYIVSSLFPRISYEFANIRNQELNRNRSDSTDIGEIEGLTWDSKQDWRGVSNTYILQYDITGGQRLPMVCSYGNTIYLFDNIKTNIRSEPFTNFFTGFSRSLTLGAVIVGVISASVFAMSFKSKTGKDGKDAVKKGKDNINHTADEDINKNTDGTLISPDLKKELDKRREIRNKNMKQLKYSLYLLVSFIIASIIGIFYYLTSVAQFKVQYTATYTGPQFSIIALIIVYPLILPTIFTLPLIYMKFAPYFADKTFFKMQRNRYRRKIAKGQIDYFILVSNQETRYITHKLTYLRRALLPLMIAFTIGVSIYKGLAEGGWAMTFARYFTDRPGLTNPENLGIIQNNVSFDRIWVEVGNFSLYCILPMFITFFFISLFIPSAWLLDDAGVVYYIKYKKYRGINDVESVSNWLLGIVGGFFGMSAIISFASLFGPFFRQIDTLIVAIDRNIIGADPRMGLLILILTLIVFPLLMSFTIILAGIVKMEQNYYNLAKKLFKRMQNGGIETTPVEISAILTANVGDKPWTEGREDIITGDDILKIKKKGLEITDGEREDEFRNISMTLTILPELVKNMNLLEAYNLLKAKILEADMYGLDELEMKLLDISQIFKVFETLLDIFEAKNKLELDLFSSTLNLSNEKIKTIMEQYKDSWDYIILTDKEIAVDLTALEEDLKEKYLIEAKKDDIIRKVLGTIFYGILTSNDTFKTIVG